jgi:hypothetical protein
MIEFTTIMAVISAIVFGARIILISIAPLTKNTVDDNILNALNLVALHLEKKK